MFGAEDYFGDLAWAAPKFVDVEGVQELDEPALLLRRQAKGGGKKLDSLATKTAHEAQCDIEPEFKRDVGRQKNGRTCAGLIAGQTNVEFAGAVDDNKLTALVVCVISNDRSQPRGIKRRELVEPARRCFEDQRSGR